MVGFRPVLAGTVSVDGALARPRDDDDDDVLGIASRCWAGKAGADAREAATTTDCAVRDVLVPVVGPAACGCAGKRGMCE